METIFLVIQESNVDGQILINITPCKDLKTARFIKDKEINTLLNESPKYKGLDLDKVERNGDDGDFSLERDDDSFFLNCLYDDYYEKIDIIEKQIV